MGKHLENYTVLVTVYKNDKVEWVEESLNSMLSQTLKPSEILVLVDGPVSIEMQKFLESLGKRENIIKVKFYEENRGLGLTLRDGIELASNELIARMDSDDISIKNRCELQVEKFAVDSGLDIVGGNVAEFVDSKENIVSHRRVPEKNEEIVKFAKKRNPFNHPTVMLKKSAVIKAGNYRDCSLCEDYDLWARMILNGAKCYNIQEDLVLMRTNPAFYERRGGVKYLKSMLKLKTSFRKMGFYSTYDFVFSSSAHIVNCLVPNSVRNIIYKKILRSDKNE